ncbi:2-oxo acid dehydrogenase subunit E2, partial [Oceanospirillum sp. HFRX-1_2]
MATEIKAPVFPESVADGTIVNWAKQPGEAVSRDELLVEIETDKVVLEVVAPADGVIKEIKKNLDETVLSDEVIAIFEEGAAGSAPAPAAEEAPAAAATPAASDDEETVQVGDKILSPAARKMADENGLDVAKLNGTGKGGRVTKEDVQKAVQSGAAKAAPAAAPAVDVNVAAGERVEKRVPMSRMRQTIAKRLVEAQQTAAMLTTYNEVDMKPVMELRKKYKDMFEKKHNGTRLGFMSFFVKAAAEALKRFPDVNASIDGTDIV